LAGSPLPSWFCWINSSTLPDKGLVALVLLAKHQNLNPMIYKLFGHTGLRVSELCLGAMTFGTEWGSGADQTESRKIFDTFVEAGGNFIDTANRYTEGTSEKFLGEFVAGDRDRFVIASKYTLHDRRDDVNASGNHRKNLVRSVEQSLRRLNTDYLDILWLHMWDFTTPVAEIMRGLDDLVGARKVHYLGISDTPAWIVAQANTLAELRGLTPFAGLQVEYSLVQRTPERDLLPMAQHFDMCVTPWSPLGAGLLTGKHNEQVAPDSRLTAKSPKINEQNRLIARKVSEVAAQLGATPAQVALAWLRQQHQQVVPIVGARRAEQLADSLGCLQVSIPEAMMAVLNEASAIDLGFPHEFLRLPGPQDALFGDMKGKISHHRV
jgi:aryl-alcohol dehydrogenase-like predicted oxidoreductase